MVEYILEIQHMIVIHLLFKGSLASLSFFGIGLMSLKDQSKGDRPLVKQRLNNLYNSNLAFSFFKASFGMSRYAFPSFALSTASETSAYEMFALIIEHNFS